MPKIGPKSAKTFAEHKALWSNCKLCPLSSLRKKVVLGKGRIPCDILFVGEAPGDSEDVLGVPFVGPAGKLLDRMIDEAGAGQFALAFTNAIACIPKGDDGIKSNDPPKCAIEACRPRLLEFIQLAKPRLIVTVGKCAEAAVKAFWSYGYNSISIAHPAAILRADISRRGVMFQEALVVLQDAVSDL